MLGLSVLLGDSGEDETQNMIASGEAHLASCRWGQNLDEI